jgi:sortase (surface protein transpeptidase)
VLLMHTVRLALRLLGLILVLILGVFGSLPTSISEQAEPGTPSALNAATPTIIPVHMADAAANPLRLIIPTIGVNAIVEQLGIQANGDLATPTQRPWEDVGWYKLGPHPGERGSAVIDGHLDRPGGYPAVFWRLSDMRVGDEVLVVNGAGKTLHFRVTYIAYYPPLQAPLQYIFGNDGGIYLNLITCAGDWIPSERQTTLRLVVYTSLA